MLKLKMKVALTDFDTALPGKLDTFEADELVVFPSATRNATDQIAVVQSRIAVVFNELDRLINAFLLRKRVIRRRRFRS